MAEQQPDAISEPLWSAPDLLKGEELQAYTSETSATIDLPDSKRDAIVQSTAEPIAIKQPDGKLEPVDTSLLRHEGYFSADTVKVKTRFPESLERAIEFPLPSGLGAAMLRLGDSKAQGELVGASKKLFYANSGTDTDAILEATPLGASVSWALRSPAAPEVLPLDFTFPLSAKFKPLDDGGVKIEIDGGDVAEIAPPVAYDAQNQPVQVSYAITKTGVSVQIPHRGKDLAYPLIVDPAIGFWSGAFTYRDDLGNDVYGNPLTVTNTPTLIGFPFSTNNGTNMTNSSTAESSGYRIAVTVRNGARGSAWANLTYDTPNNATIFRVHFTQVVHSPAQYSTLGIGIARATGGWESQASGWYGGSCTNPNGCWGGGAFGNTPGMSSSDVQSCASGSCGMGGSGNNQAVFQMLLSVPSGSRTTTSPRVSTRGAYVYFSDYNAPSMSISGTSAQWTNNAAITAQVNDNGGVGVGHKVVHAASAFDLLVDGASQINNGFGAGPMCVGGFTNPCPTAYTHSYTIPPAHDGIRQYQFRGADIVGQTNPQNATLKIDRAGPEIDLSGKLGTFALDTAYMGSAQPRTLTTNAPYVIKATDGKQLNELGNPAIDGDRRSGVASISAEINSANSDGTENQTNHVKTWIPKTSGGNIGDCDPDVDGNQDSCPLSFGGDFLAGEGGLAPGIYYFRVTATDFAGNSATKVFKVGVGVADNLSVIEGQASARYVPIQIKKRTSTTSTALRLQFRTDNKDSWCEIPASAVQFETDGAAVGAWPFSLGVNDTTPRMVIDLDKLRLDHWHDCANATFPVADGPVRVRALMEGSGSEATRASEDVTIRYDRGGKDTNDDSSSVGPGSVDLVTGNFATTATDVSIDAFKSDLTVSRSYNSRYGDAVGVLGRGWSLGLPVETAGAAYKQLTDNADVDLPEEVRMPSVEIEATDGSIMVFELTEEADVYRAEVGLESLKLERIKHPGDETRTAGFTLKDLDSGSVVTFKTRAQNNAPGVWSATEISEPGLADKITYSYRYDVIANKAIVDTAFAPTGSSGINCGTNFSSTPRGCQALKFNYVVPAGITEKRLGSITLRTYDPELAQMRELDVAQYSYNSMGRLIEVWDPRISPALKTTYEYNTTAGHALLLSVKPAGEEPFTLTYSSLPEDNKPGRLNTASRSALSAGTATSAMRYFVPTTQAVSSSAPHDMTAVNVAAWGQENPPWMAAAVFPPDQQPNGTPATNYDRASISYLDPLGREVNAAEPGGRLNVTEYNKYGEVTRTLSAENRERAMNQADSVAASEKWDTQSTYDEVTGTIDDRRHLVESIGPEHSVRLADGTWLQARQHTRITYDEDSPIAGNNTKEPFDLPTTTRTSALVDGVDHDVRTTKTYYDSDHGASPHLLSLTERENHWKLRIARETITDPGSGNLDIKRRVTINADGLETERFQPRSQASNQPSTTRTVYYSAGANPDDSACENRPEWIGLPCKVGPGAQPTAATGMPELPVQTITYNYLRQPLTSAESVKNASGGNETRASSKTYDAAGRVITESVTGSLGASVKTTKHIYDPATGRETTTQSLNSDGSVDKTVGRSYDTLGRTVAYSDSASHVSTTTYDLLSRVATTNDSKATRTHGYDPITGELVSVQDSGAGLFTGSYDNDGRLIAATLPNGIVKTIEYDTAGSPSYLEYSKTTGCSSACILFWNYAVENIHGQTVSLSGELTQSGKETGQEYKYDAAGRLIRTDDWEDDGADWTCTPREYELDADSNRTAYRSAPPAGSCGSTTTSKTSTYDAADRLTNSGYVYDAFGRITTVPQADTGGSSDMSASYYVNDLARSITQDGTTQTLDLDPLQRMATKTKTGATSSTETYAYDGDSDSPAWTQTGSSWTRFAAGIGGDMEATQASSGSVKVAINNLRGDTVAEATATGLTDVRRVDEFGVVTGGLPASRRYGFHGSKQREALTGGGTIAMGVRLYVPRVGRFMQVDPVRGASAGLYEYALQDPVNVIDLDGRAPNCKVRVNTTREMIETNGYEATWRVRIHAKVKCKRAVKNLTIRARFTGATYAGVRTPPKPFLSVSCGESKSCEVSQDAYISGPLPKCNDTYVGTFGTHSMATYGAKKKPTTINVREQKTFVVSRVCNKK